MVLIAPFRPLVFLVAAMMAGPATADLLTDVREAGTLRVANTQAHPPWDFLDDTGALGGLGVELAREIARRIGVAEVEFVPARFQDLIPGIEAGRFDLVMAGHTITPERDEVVDFSNPYMVVGTSVFVREGDEEISTVLDLAGRTVGVLAGSVQEGWIAETFPGGEVSVSTYGTPAQALSDLAFGRVDGVIYSNDAGAWLAAEQDLAVEAATAVDRETNGMVMREDEDEFRDAVNGALDEMIEDGTYAEMSARWLGGLDMAEELRLLDQ